ncbi:hypothetical protein [Lactobacillus hominis]|uniref:Uncharacterized protein n=1 Tax=Lactobacillus hominis DSM 23910 = CRBIP 24.179 TaxID=1423758 RepID=I7L625_9LACO|nr:hypothetical protein [Lactobacillus hominis]KRM85707.1 hypothetical protein FC41_GL001021 [Lactobacillus hominis DSM 23910 = CRBIP 24.179]MCT3347244.1 hypothetical protein [Lactobacillus hominis]CCI81772.1 Putative uncharacterized protein [Lactobacillus hominis DSM 23910 = CRBIP 24.179]
MQESDDKALLRAGFNLHNVFNNMIKNIQTDTSHWLEIVEANVDQISDLISSYHKIAAQIKQQTLENSGLPSYLENANLDMLNLMDSFNQEILDFDDFVDLPDHEKAFTKFVLTVNSSNEMLLRLKYAN